MHRITKVKAIEGISIEMLQSEINRFINDNKRLHIIDVKYVVYVADVDEEFIEDVGDDKETRFSALLTIGEEI